MGIFCNTTLQTDPESPSKIGLSIVAHYRIVIKRQMFVMNFTQLLT